MSASAFYGDGSNLSGISGDGIFTTIDGSNAYVTSSLNIGGNTAPDHQVVVSGSLSSSVNVSASAFYGSAANLTLASGSMAGPGSYLALDTNNNVVLATGDGATSTPAGDNTQVQFNNASSFGASANFTFDGTALTANTGLVHSRTTVVTAYTASAGNYILGVTGVPTAILFDATS